MGNRSDVIEQKLQLLIRKFKEVLYEDDEKFLEGMKATAVPPQEILKYRHWEWTQGVGLYGFWQYFRQTGDPAVLDELVAYYEARLAEGLPGRNVNTTGVPAPDLGHFERPGAVGRHPVHGGAVPGQHGPHREERGLDR